MRSDMGQGAETRAWTGFVQGSGRVARAALLCLTLASCAGAPDAPTTPSAATARSSVKVEPQRDWSDAVLYFVILDRYADGDAANNTNVDRNNPGGFHGGDLQGLTAQLDEIASLGATAIWITPIVQQISYCPPAQPPNGISVPGGWFEHCAFHGYWAEDFTKIDPRFGSEADLKALVDAAHARGMKVLLDVVYNHAGYDAHYLKDPATADWFRKKPVDCAVEELHCQVGGLPDFRTELPEVQDYLLDAHLGLAQRTGLDGFRLDTVKHVEHEFWQRHRRETRARIRPDFFLLGEVWGGSAVVLDDWFTNDEMDSGFDFTFKGSCESFVQGKGRAIAFSSYLEKRHKVRPGYLLAHYLSSHDEPMSLYNLGGDKDAFRLCVALQMTSAGIPVVYYGEEVGRPDSVWPLNRGDMHWGGRNVPPGKGLDRDESMRAYYQKLIGLRREHLALSAGAYRRLYSEGDLLVFERADISGNAVIVGVNRGRADANANVPLPPAWNGAAVVDALGDSPAAIEAGALTVRIPARKAAVYVRR